MHDVFLFVSVVACIAMEVLTSLCFSRPGQEEGNIPFVEDSGFGKYSSDPKDIAESVTSWLSDPKLLAQMQRCALNSARPQATLDIARDLADMLFEQKQLGQSDRAREKVLVSK